MREDAGVVGLEPEDETRWTATGNVQRIARRPDQRWIRFTLGGGTGTIPVREEQDLPRRGPGDDRQRRGVMPADLVEGQELEELLAYLETIAD